MEEFLAFADAIGRTLDGKHRYRLDFTVDTETVWGEFFNVANNDCNAPLRTESDATD